MKYLMYGLVLLSAVALLIFDAERGRRMMAVVGDGMWQVLQVLPPVMVLSALIDEWIPAHLMVSWMGKEAGWRGFALALLLSTVAAGPLFMAFPVAAMLAKKGARYACVMCFLGGWGTMKLTLLLFEVSCLGVTFTCLRLVVSLPLLVCGALCIERWARPQDMTQLMQSRL